MKKSRFTESQIRAVLKETDTGMKVKEVCREHGISNATYYNWKAKYGGMEASDVKHLKELEEENAKLKKMYADVIDAISAKLKNPKKIDFRVFQTANWISLFE